MKEVYDINIFNDPNITAEDKELLQKGLDVSFDSDKDAAFAAGCNDFIAKPVKKRELVELLSKYCNG